MADPSSYISCRQHCFNANVSFSGVSSFDFSKFSKSLINGNFHGFSHSFLVWSRSIKSYERYCNWCSKTFWRIVKHRSTEDFESLPYICTLLNSSLWTYYGIIKPGEYLVATINGFGVVVEIVYVLLFLLYAPTNMRVYYNFWFFFFFSISY